MSTKHTPGPWFASSNDDGKSWSVISLSMTTKKTICYIYGNRAQETKSIDARLIAAAPDMLAALELAAQKFRVYTHDDQVVLNAIRDAIAKAEKGPANV